MMAQLKVYGGTLRGTHRAIVAAHSVAEVSRIFADLNTPMQVHYLRNFWCVTGNPKEIELAMAKPGTVFHKSNRRDTDPYVEYRKA